MAVTGQHAFAGRAVAVVAALTGGAVLLHVVVELGSDQRFSNACLSSPSRPVLAHR